MAMSAASAPVTSAGPRTHFGEPLALALHRLAHKAHEEGLVILDDLGAAPFACRVSSSRPGHFPYVVTLTPGPAARLRLRRLFPLGALQALRPLR